MPVLRKILIKYYSISGNTKETASLISQYIGEKGFKSEVSSMNKRENPEQYDLIFIGSMTVGDGKTPTPVRRYLKWLLKDHSFSLPYISAFGTGDTQWQYYCRAVDEIEYHCNKETTVLGKLKIEQYPINQHNKIKYYVDDVLDKLEELDAD
jgi:predicted ribonucleotide reductase-associated flavodoxin